MTTASDSLAPARLDEQYNNRARVSDHPAVLARWAEASAHTRAHARCTLEVPYGEGERERLDVFPTDAPDAPVLVFIHGGYWRALDKSSFSFVAPSFTADGALVVVPNYPLAPATSVEDIVRSLVRALQWVWANAAAHGGDPSRIAIAGHSAGGHMGTMLLSCRWKDVDARLPAQLVSGVLSISGLYDVEPLRHAPFIRDDLALTPASVKRLSPAFFPRPRGKLYATVGMDESDAYLRQNQLIRDQWGPSAVPVCETIPRANHFTVLHGLADPQGRLHELALRMLGLR